MSLQTASLTPSQLPFRTNRASALVRFLSEDVRYWLNQPRKKPVLRQVREAIDLGTRYGFVPYQYFKHDLFLQDVAGDAYKSYIPSLLADRYVYEINPRACIDWLEDKMQFDMRMEAAGLPFVRTLAILRCADGAVSAVDRQERPLTFVELWSLMRRQSPRGVFVKPRFGLGGQGAFRLAVGATGFEREGAELSEVDLVSRLRASGFREFLIQPYFEQHEELARINPKSVNTLRILTLRNENEVDVFAAYFRVGGANSETDNGSYGGYAAHANLQTGEIGAVGKVHLSFASTRGAERHPVTGVAFGSVRLPHREAVVDLVTRGARAFAPLRVIGWDIAIGADGPCAIEANSIPGFRPVQDVCGGLRHTSYGQEMADRFRWR